jgi:DNA repair protein RadC
VAELLQPFAGRRSGAAADRLIGHFGGLGRALAATREQLAAALPDDPELVATLVAARRLIGTGLAEELRRAPVSPDDPNYRDYLRFCIGNSAVECLHATFVTAEWGYLADDRIAVGSLGHVEPDLRFLLGRAFDVGAHGILLAHNHPSGSAEPSPADIAMTRRLAGLTRAVGVILLDHLIVGGATIISMKERNLL